MIRAFTLEHTIKVEAQLSTKLALTEISIPWFVSIKESSACVKYETCYAIIDTSLHFTSKVTFELEL